MDKKLTSKNVRELLGGISDMTLWRYLHDENLNFPKPTYIKRNRMWSSKELSEWFDSRPREFDSKPREEAPVMALPFVRSN